MMLLLSYRVRKNGKLWGRGSSHKKFVFAGISQEDSLLVIVYPLSYLKSVIIPQMLCFFHVLGTVNSPRIREMSKIHSYPKERNIHRKIASNVSVLTRNLLEDD